MSPTPSGQLRNSLAVCAPGASTPLGTTQGPRSYGPLSEASIGLVPVGAAGLAGPRTAAKLAKRGEGRVRGSLSLSLVDAPAPAPGVAGTALVSDDSGRHCSPPARPAPRRRLPAGCTMRADGPAPSSPVHAQAPPSDSWPLAVHSSRALQTQKT